MLGALSEFSYLTAQKATLYRRIMRLFFESHTMQRSSLPPEDVLSALELSDYPLEDTLRDLESLCDWGNLSKRRDTRRAGSLAEYSRRRDLYYATSRGLSIEEFLENGLDSADENAAVGAGVVGAIEQRLESLKALLENLLGFETPQMELLETLETLWRELYQDFTLLSADARGLAANLERKLSLEALEEFIEFKDAVRQYVERLARELAGAGRRVRQKLSSFTPLQSEGLLHALATVRSGRLTTSANLLDYGKAERRASSEWSALSSWFSRPLCEGDGLEYAIDALRGAVSRVLAFVDALYRTRELGLGRAGALETLARELLEISDPLEARQKLATQLKLFGALHLVGDVAEESVINAWKEPLEPIRLQAVSKGKRAERAAIGAVGSTTPQARAAAKAALEAYRTRERALLGLLESGGGVLNLDGLELSDPQMLQDILNLLEAGREGRAAGPEGRLVEVEFLEQSAVLRGPDWSLLMEKGAILRLVSSENDEGDEPDGNEEDTEDEDDEVQEEQDELQLEEAL